MTVSKARWRRRFAAMFGAAMLVAAAPAHAEDPPIDPALLAAVGSTLRSPRLRAFDATRHPGEELTFFGLRPDATVVEAWPAGGYWTEILAPYLRERGTLYAALEYHGPDSPDHDVALKRDGYYARRIDDAPALFRGVKLTAFGPGRDAMAPPNSVDLILGVRDLHVWMKQGFAEEALADCYNALKPGGVLALIDHRGHRDVEQDSRAADGYVRQDYAVSLAELAGFELEASSEIESNPKDTASWPKGVWTLSPTFAQGEQDRERYAAIGEPDNFVLKFRKPR